MFRYVQGFPVVPLGGAGRLWPFVLDTGSEDMLVAPWAASAMGLRPDPGRRTPVLGMNGALEAPNVLLAGLLLGEATLPPRSVPAAALPGFEELDPSPAGILGATVLSKYDVLLDGPGQYVALYSVVGCQAVPVPLVPPLARVPLARSPRGELLVRVQLGGVPVEALLDTGARGTVVDPAVPRAGAPGLRVGEDWMPDLRPTASPVLLERGQALLGMDYFGRRRAWISYSTDALVVELPRPAPPRP